MKFHISSRSQTAHGCLGWMTTSWLSHFDLPTNFTWKNFKIVFTFGGQQISIRHQPYISIHISHKITFTNKKTKQNFWRVFVVTRLASTTVTRNKTSKSSNNYIYAILRHYFVHWRFCEWKSPGGVLLHPGWKRVRRRALILCVNNWLWNWRWQQGFGFYDHRTLWG